MEQLLKLSPQALPLAFCGLWLQGGMRRDVLKELAEREQSHVLMSTVGCLPNRVLLGLLRCVACMSRGSFSRHLGLRSVDVAQVVDDGDRAAGSCKLRRALFQSLRPWRPPTLRR